MIKHTLMFTSPVILSLKNRQLVITSKENGDKLTRPIEDIGFVIIDNPMVSVTMPVASLLDGVGLVPSVV